MQKKLGSYLYKTGEMLVFDKKNSGISLSDQGYRI